MSSPKALSPTDQQTASFEKRTQALFMLIFALLTAAVAAAGVLSYQSFSRQFRAQVNAQLLAIANLKVSGLVEWRGERLTDAQMLADNAVFAALFARLAANPADAEAQAQLQNWLDALRPAYQYDRVYLVDKSGNVLLASPPGSVTAFPHQDEALQQALETGEAAFLDFHPHGDAGINIGILAPIDPAPGASPALGAVVLEIDPAVYLYPYIQQWPAPSQTAETLLVRREGEEIVYLTPLRFEPDAALHLRLPLDQSDILAVQAALGRTGTAEGRDYRGQKVVGAIMPVPDSPWYLVARMDADEVFAPLTERLWQTFLFFGALMLTGGAGLFVAWRQQRLRYYRGQVEMLEALRLSEEKFKQVFMAANVGKSITLPGGEINVNQAFCDMLGYSREELRSKKWQDITPADDIDEIQAKIQPLLEGREDSIRLIKRYVHKNNSIVWADVSTTLHRDASGKPQYFITTVVDITERKRAEEQLAQYAEKLEEMVEERTRALRAAQEQLVRQERLAALGQVAGSIGHELRNPLGVIANAVYFLKAVQPDANQTVREYLDIIEKQTRSADKTVSDLLDFTRIKSLDRQPVSVSEIVQQTLAYSPAPPQVTVTVSVPADLPPVCSDPRHVVQILGNLVNNACDAMPEGGKLTLSAQAQRDMIAIAVQDTGIGIPPENLSKIFEPLFTTKTKGIGLGLAVSQKLAEANGGRIEVQSEAGEGSVFTLFLPVYKET